MDNYIGNLWIFLVIWYIYLYEIRDILLRNFEQKQRPLMATSQPKSRKLKKHTSFAFIWVWTMLLLESVPNNVIKATALLILEYFSWGLFIFRTWPVNQEIDATVKIWRQNGDYYS